MLIGNLRRRPRDVGWLAAWFVVQALPSVASGWVIAKGTQAFLAGHAATGIGWLGLLAGAALAGAWGTRMAYIRLGALVEPLRDELVELIVTGSLARSMDTARPADTEAVGRITHQAEIVRDAYGGVIWVTCTFACTAASTLAGLVTLVPATLPYSIPPLLCALVIMRLLLKPFAGRQRDSVIGEEAVAGSAAKAMSGLRDVTACGAEEQVLEELTKTIGQQAAAASSVARVGSARLACVTAGGWLPLILVLAAGPSLLRRGVSPAYLVGAIAYISGGLRSALYTLSQGVGASMVRLTVTLDRIVEASTAQAPDREEIEQTTGKISLRDVTFGYGQHAEPIIRDLTIDIHPGEHLAIVGPSGIGKSSLAYLIAGMLHPSVGEIRTDSGRVLIPQEAYVFEGTLAENIRYLRDDGDVPETETETETELDAAAEAVGLKPLVNRLGGYDATVSAAALSAGERQLIALARAYLAAAPVTILDEATCHLDPAGEARAEQAFAGAPGTLIVIAHRISSALRADRILVLDGTRAQAGEHRELLVSSAMYRDLVGYWSTANNPDSFQAATSSR